MKSLKDYIITMQENMDHQDDPLLGIFWYDKQNEELFGVVTEPVESCKTNPRTGLKTSTLLHKKVWAKLHNKNKFKEKNKDIRYNCDYKDVPRGRLFYDPETEEFIIAVGSWINDKNCCNREYVKQLIIDEFELHNQIVKIEILNNIIDGEEYN